MSFTYVDPYTLFILNEMYPPLLPLPTETLKNVPYKNPYIFSKIDRFSPNTVDYESIRSLKYELTTTSPIIILNKVSRKLYLQKPKYIVLNSIEQLYLCEVEFNGNCFQSPQPRYQRRDVKEDAAMVALDYLFDHLDELSHRTPTRANETTPQILVVTPDKNYVSLLFELCATQGWEEPVFKFEGSFSEAVFYCNVLIEKEGWRYIYRGGKMFRKKRSAKENAARVVFEDLTRSLILL